LRSETYAADTARTLSSQRRIRGTRSFLGIQTGRGNKTSHVPRTLTTERWEILFLHAKVLLRLRKIVHSLKAFARNTAVTITKGSYSLRHPTGTTQRRELRIIESRTLLRFTETA